MRIVVDYIRHGLSCSNVIPIYGLRVDRPIDPPLTDLAFEYITKYGHEMVEPVDLVFSSTMLRAEETAMCLFPRRRIIIAPFMKEIGRGRENILLDYADRSHNGNDYSNVVVGNPPEWTDDAQQTSPHNFVDWLYDYVEEWLKGDPLRIHSERVYVAITTHHNVIQKLFNLTTTSPNNVSRIRITYKNRRRIRLPYKQSVRFDGMVPPDEITGCDIGRCTYR